MLREVVSGVTNSIRILLLENLVQNVRVEECGVHALLGRPAQVSPLKDRLFHVINLVIREPFVNIAPVG